MTVCVATMANDGLIACVADRMLTRGVTQTEPKAAKIYHYDNPVPVTVMWSGSSIVFGEIVQSCLTAALAQPKRYQSIEDYVALYCDTFARFLGKRAERAILTRMGLTLQDIVSSKFSNDRANALMREIGEHRATFDDTVEVIIAGHDATGPHIWRVSDDQPSCHDLEGFAAIGSGAEHADSHLRFAGYSRQSATAQEALIMAYFAKRRAEMAPFVGRTTDVWVRNPDRTAGVIPNDWLRKFDREYEKFARRERQALTSAVASVRTVLTALVQSVTSQMPPSVVTTSAQPDPVEASSSQ